MESNIERITKTHFSHFIIMTLQNRMSWKTLASLFTELAPTLNETREIISILLKELEALQSIIQQKEELLQKYQKRCDDFEEIKRVWKQMVKNNHPDKLIGKGMPIEFINTANHRLAAINSAFEEIKKFKKL